MREESVGLLATLDPIGERKQAQFHPSASSRFCLGADALMLRPDPFDQAASGRRIVEYPPGFGPLRFPLNGQSGEPI